MDILAPAAGDSQHGSLAARDYLRRAAEAYDGGAAGLSLWDCDRRTITRSQ